MTHVARFFKVPTHWDTSRSNRGYRLCRLADPVVSFVRFVRLDYSSAFGVLFFFPAPGCVL